MTLRSAPKHNYAQERSTAIINLEGVEYNEKNSVTTKHFERPRERTSGRVHTLPRQISILTRTIHYYSQQRDGN